MRRNIAISICQLAIVVVVATSTRVSYAQTVKVACVGDSITALPSSWCGTLSSKLGSGYMVQNFGVSGTNLAKGVSQPYWSSAQYTPSHTFAPNIVIIMLGTNDAFTATWSGAKTHFVADYEELLGTYTSLASKPKPYMIIPTPIGTSPFGHDGKLLATEVVPLVKQVAMEKMVPTIDAFTLFGGAMFDAGLYGSSDQVHPNAKGQQMIGEEVYKVLMSTGALGGSGTAGSGVTAGTGASAGSGGMAAAIAGSSAAAGAAAMAMAGANPGAAGSGAGTATPTGAAGSGANVGGSAKAGSSANTGSTATTAGSMSLAGAAGGANAGNSSSINGIGVAGNAGGVTTAPPSGDAGGCRTAGSASTNSGPTATLVLLLGLALRRRKIRGARAAKTFRNGAHL
jgi:acyl-CoA thioesterase-1